MNVVQITPGAGGMFCGNCLRDNTLVADLRKLGHQVLFVPLYLPLRLDETDESEGTPVFYGGVNVYLEQRFPSFRRAPRWLRQWLSSPALLNLAGSRAAKTRPEDVGDIALSMLRGEEGNQRTELEDLLSWLKAEGRTDVVCLSNVLLIGLARGIREQLGCRVVIQLSGEDSFLDALPEAASKAAWDTVRGRLSEVDGLIAPSRYYAALMAPRLGVETKDIWVLPNGIHLDGFVPSGTVPYPPVLGYFARMCKEKGLDTLVEAYCLLRKRKRIQGLRLHIGGSCGPADQPFVDELRKRLASEGYQAETAFYPNLERSEKQQFLRSLSVFSVPARYNEAFGLYLIEAMAAGVPVVQPNHAAFPEILEATRGGLLCEPENPESLAAGVEALLRSPDEAHAVGQAARERVFRLYSAQEMARKTANLYTTVMAH